MNLRKYLIPLLLLSGLVVSACALEGVSQQADSTQAPTEPTVEATLAEQNTAEPTLAESTPESSPSPTENALNLTLSSGDLANYRNRLILTFSGQDAQGSATKSLLEVMVEEDKPNNASHRMSRDEIQGQKPGSLDLYRTGQGVFLVSTESSNGPAGCLKTAAQGPTASQERIPAPAGLIQIFGRGELIGSGDKINSATTDHYHLNGIGISFGKIDKSDGDIWIDQQTGLVVRLNGWAEGAFSLGGGASYGRVEWQYNLNKAANAQISLPADCQALAENDLPFPQNSGDPKQSGAELSFEVQAKPALTAAFYRTELLKRGWTIDTDAGGGTTFVLDATKNERGLHITITTLDQGARVVIQRK